MSADDERAADIAHCQRAVDQLVEQFDSVQIFVTRHLGAGSGTKNISWGAGNFFTRYGQVSIWVEKEREDQREGVRKENRE